MNVRALCHDGFAGLMARRVRQATGLAALIFAAGLVPLSAALANTAQSDPALICETVALRVSESEGVPLSVLRAIALNETGRRREGRFRPWPWTVNMEGAGHWFDDRQAALGYATREYQRGARSFDIGCFQINYKWHGQHFTSIEEMFDPMANALYAARHLRDLYAELGSWDRAAGAYHSRSPEHAEPYAARFSRLRNQILSEGGEAIPEVPATLLAALGAMGGGDIPDVAAPRVNTFPLLQAGGGAALGSLVPVANGAGGVLFGASPPPAGTALMAPDGEAAP